MLQPVPGLYFGQPLSISPAHYSSQLLIQPPPFPHGSFDATGGDIWHSIPDWVKNPCKLAEAVARMMVPKFQPKKDVHIETDEKATNLSTASIDDAAVINELLVKVEQCCANLQPGFRMKPIQFEKVFPISFLSSTTSSSYLEVI